MSGHESKTIATNKKAFHDYFVEEALEAGIELCGTEVKSLRQGGCQPQRMPGAASTTREIFVNGMHISPLRKRKSL